MRTIRDGSALVLVDGANVRAACASLGKRVDATRMRQWLSAYGYPQIEWFQGAYPGTAGFFNHLRAAGIRVHTRIPKTLPDGRRKADMDVELAVAAMLAASVFETVILFSGDGDFEPLVRYFAEAGKRVVVVAMVTMLDPALTQHLDPVDVVDFGAAVNEFGFDVAPAA